jgi:molecular chaperone DnaK
LARDVARSGIKKVNSIKVDNSAFAENYKGLIDWRDSGEPFTAMVSPTSVNFNSVEIHVVQGERQMASDNKSLGRFILDGIAPATRGMPQVEVTFDIDANGILAVKAKDKGTGKEQSIRIEASSGLSETEIEKMRKDAEAHADEDQKKKELVEAKNGAEQLGYTAEKSLKDHADKISPELKGEIEQALKAVRDVKDSSDVADIRAKTDVLSSSLQKIGAALNKEQAPNEKKDADASGEAQ